MFEHNSSQQIIKQWIADRPNKGHGEGKKIAAAVGCSPVLISQFLGGTRNLNLEQIERLGRYMVLTKIERKFLMLLTLRDNSGTKELRAEFDQEIQALVKQSKQVANRLDIATNLSKEDSIEFYSSWQYSAVRLLCESAQYDKIDKIAERLKLDEENVSNLMDFLIKTGLCIVERNKLKLGPAQTHLPASNPLVISRQIQWRTKAFNNMQSKKETDLFYTAPMVISEKDYKKIREKIIELIAELNTIAVQSEPEDLFCFQADLFRV